MSSALFSHRTYEPVALGITRKDKARDTQTTFHPVSQKPRGKYQFRKVSVGRPSIPLKDRIHQKRKPSIRSTKSRIEKPFPSKRSSLSYRSLPEAIRTVPVFFAAFIVIVLLCGGFLDQWLLSAGIEENVSIPVSSSMPEPSVPVDLASVAGPTTFSSLSTFTESSALVFTRHRVIKGETLARIAFNYGLSPATLISVNSLKEPGDIHSGIVIVVPYTDGIRIPVKNKDTQEIAEKYGVDVESVRTLPDGSFFVMGKDLLPTISASFSEDAFLCPVDGKILTAFGQSVDTITGIPYRSEGIDFSISSGTPVQTAKFGTVVLTGQHSSYGLYVMMSHPGGWKSFYGHLSRVDVAIGDELERGAILGLSGDSGTARTPRLHFSLIKDGDLMDPLDYLF